MGRQDATQKKGETRQRQNKWGDKMRDEKRMERQDARPKNWGDETLDEKK